jgi:putative restriction endonuclease
MNVYVYPTDRDWYGFLSREPNVDEVNFWRPGGKQPFTQLAPGDLLLFRLGKPHNAIVGGGTYTHFSFAPLAQVWDAFGRKNGAASFHAFVSLIARTKKLEGSEEQVANAIIGNIVLTAPFFLPPDRWIPVPEDYQVNSPQGQRFDASHGSGKMLLEAFRDAVSVVFQPVHEGFTTSEVQFGESVVRRRLGQGGFALVVADAYERRCAVSGEKTYPVLEAAHIVPVIRGGPHSPDNGLLLRSDIHKLFDRGYVTVQPNGEFRVSTRLKEDWHNGRIYYEHHGRTIRLPSSAEWRPARERLEWHNDTVFRE